MDNMLRIGVITTTHGLKGEVKVFPTTDDVARFNKLEKCFIRTKQGDIEVEKSSCKFFKKLVILSFKEFDNINQVEKFKQCEIYVTRDNAVELEEDEYFISDVIDSIVVDEEGNEIGILEEVLITGANDVYVVKTKDNKELLLPVINECVKDIDILNKRIKVKMMKGLE